MTGNSGSESEKITETCWSWLWHSESYSLAICGFNLSKPMTQLFTRALVPPWYGCA